jgi:ribosomal protein L16 Arg81 hydroxylase
MLSSLTDIVSPIAVSQFLKAFHEKKRLHIKATDPARGESLLPWQEIETMISMRSFDDMHVMQNGMRLPPQLYTAADMSDFHDILVQGASVVLPQIQLNIPQIQWLAMAIERQMGFAVGVNAYLSFARGGAFKPHWDKHDVLVVQVHGSKTWRLWEREFENPIESSNQAGYEISDAHSEELELSPGDALYIPRGEAHAASVSAGASVHLTFGLDSLNGVDVLQQLNHAAGQDEFLRADLPPQAAEAQLRDYEAELKARLHRLVDALDIAKFLKEDDANRPPIRHASLASTEEPSDILRLTLRRRVRLPDGGSSESQSVTIGGAVYPLSPASIDILRQLFGNDCQSRSALSAALSPLHTKSAVTAGLRDLLRLGFLMTDRTDRTDRAV